MSLKDVANKNIKILNINYEKDISILNYKLTVDNSKKDLSKLFPNVTNMNISCNKKWILDLKVTNTLINLKEIKILTDFSDDKKMKNIIQKFAKKNKKIIFEYPEEDEDYEEY